MCLKRITFIFAFIIFSSSIQFKKHSYCKSKMRAFFISAQFFKKTSCLNLLNSLTDRNSWLSLNAAQSKLAVIQETFIWPFSQYVWSCRDFGIWGILEAKEVWLYTCSFYKCEPGGSSFNYIYINNELSALFY